MKHIKVGEVMTHDPFIISPQKTVKAAAKLMKELDCGVLPVGTHPEKVVGMITDRDITIRVTAEGKDASQTRIEDVMTRKVHTCEVGADVEDAAEQMRKHDVCRLLVTKGGKATGIVTLAELIRNKSDIHMSDEVLHELLGVRQKHHENVVKMASAGAGCESCE